MAKLLVVQFPCPACLHWLQRALVDHGYINCPRCGSRVKTTRVFDAHR